MRFIESDFHNTSCGERDSEVYFCVKSNVTYFLTRVAEFDDYLNRRIAQRVDIKPKPFRVSFGERVTLHSVKD